MKKSASTTFVIIIFMFMLCLAIFADRYIPICFDGIKLWAVVVLPSLLPFFFLTTLLTYSGTLESFGKVLSPITNRLYKTSGISAYVQIMSWLSGYPIGAKIISELYVLGSIDETEATKMACLASTSGPLFIVGSVANAMFGNKALGAILLCTHILSSIFCGIVFRSYKSKKTHSNSKQNKLIIKNNLNNDNILYASIYQSVISILIVGGFVAIFYTLAQILSDFKILKIIEIPFSLLFGDSAKAFSLGIIECTAGCKLLSKSKTVLNASLAAALIAFGGLSVMCQSFAYLKKANVSVKIFFLSKLLQMLFAFTTVFCLTQILGIFR